MQCYGRKPVCNGLRMNGSKEREVRIDCNFKISAYVKCKGEVEVA